MWNQQESNFHPPYQPLDQASEFFYFRQSQQPYQQPSGYQPQYPQQQMQPVQPIPITEAEYKKLLQMQQQYMPQNPMYTGPNASYHHPHSGMTAKGTHVHEFIGNTEDKTNHQHMFVGTTEPGPNGVQHTHKYFTVTKYVDGHRHELKGETGPAIPLPGGGHVHLLKGKTFGYTKHQHSYTDQTQKSMG